jgi:DNA recombination protein RmuC
MEFVPAALVVVAVVVGIVVAIVLHQRGSRSQREEALAGDLRAARAELERVRQEKESARSEGAALTERARMLEQQLEAERQAAGEKLRLLDEARITLADQFKLVAGEIMEANAARFVEQSQTNLGTALDPLRERLSEFQRKVEEVYVNEGKDRAALKDQVQRLVDLNGQLSEDAKNLTSALRGSNKSQGNWGELILQRILEDAGLRPGAEFVLQDAQTNDDGRRQQPDVVIQLPEGRKIVVDAKVSLLAFERASSAESEEEKRIAVREHIASLRAHIKGLSEREYDKLYGVTLDFVIMFVPIEPAFMLAMANDEKLSADAWQRNVLLVSPSTLLFVLRTVAYLWRQEAQSRNAKEIANRGALLYDKLVGFVTDLESVGARIEAAQQSYNAAHRKLSSGRGSVIRQAELLRELGVKPSRQLPRGVVDAADVEDAESDADGEGEGEGEG